MPGGGFIDMDVVWRAMLTFAAGVLMAVAAIMFLMSRYGSRLVGHRAELTHRQNVEDGYIGVDTSVATLVGSQAVTATALHPSGKITVAGEIYDAVLGGFIDEGVPVRIVRFENAQLYVRADRP